MVAPCPTDIIFRTVTSTPSIQLQSSLRQNSTSTQGCCGDFTTSDVLFFPDDPAVQGLDKSRHLQTGEMIIIVVVLVMWAGRFNLC